VERAAAGGMIVVAAGAVGLNAALCRIQLNRRSEDAILPEGKVSTGLETEGFREMLDWYGLGEIPIDSSTRRLVEFCDEVFRTLPTQGPFGDIRGFSDRNLWVIKNEAKTNERLRKGNNNKSEAIEDLNGQAFDRRKGNPDQPIDGLIIYKIEKYDATRAYYNLQTGEVRGMLTLNGITGPGPVSVDESYWVFVQYLLPSLEHKIMISRDFKAGGEVPQFQGLNEEETRLLADRLKRSFESRWFPLKKAALFLFPKNCYNAT